jgi:hypothetical protein
VCPRVIEQVVEPLIYYRIKLIDFTCKRKFYFKEIA